MLVGTATGIHTFWDGDLSPSPPPSPRFGMENGLHPRRHPYALHPGTMGMETGHHSHYHSSGTERDGVDPCQGQCASGVRRRANPAVSQPCASEHEATVPVDSFPSYALQKLQPWQVRDPSRQPRSNRCSGRAATSSALNCIPVSRSPLRHTLPTP